MLNLILFGPPGSGKGTQAVKIAEKYNLVHISTGDLFRSEIAAETPLGLKAGEYMRKGELVPDEVTIGMLKNKVLANSDVNGYIFDGFPRTVAQAEALDDLMESLGQDISGLIALDVDEEEIVKRILKRAIDSGRADDANESIIRNRFKVYSNETAVLYDYYLKKGKAHRIKGVGGIEEIFNAICQQIDRL